MTTYLDIMEANASRLRMLYEEIHRTCSLEPDGKAHEAACAEFHAQYDSLAFPGGWERSIEGIKAGAPDVIEIALQYLEAEPRFFRSGYIAEAILRHLKHVDLTKDQVTRLVSIALDSITAGGRRRFNNCARLGAVLKDERIVRGAQDLLKDADAEVNRRARRTLDLLKGSKRMMND